MIHDPCVLTLTHGLADLLMAEPADDPLACEEADQERRPGRERSADGGELKDLKAGRLVQLRSVAR